MTALSRTDLPDLRLLEADRSTPDRAGSPAAQQLLARVLQTSRAGSVPAPRRGRRRWAVAGAAALTTAAVVLPGALGGSAYAGWTPTPVPAATAEAAALEADCLTAGRVLGQRGAVTAAITERRGGYAFSLVATEAAVGGCLVLDEALASGSEERAAQAWGSLQDLPVPAADGTTVQWGATYRSSAGAYTSALGRTGPDVVAVEVSSSDHPEGVQALVGEGWFTAWWPGGADDTIDVTTTLVDGSQRTRRLTAGDV